MFSVKYYNDCYNAKDIGMRNMFHSLQLNAKVFFFNMLVAILHTWLTKLTNDQNNRKESREILLSWFN